MSRTVEAQAFSLPATDGYALAATRYPATGHKRGHLVVAPATAVPQRFYRRFAEHAAARGLEVWTLDYRGVGGSKPATLRGFEMDYLDWAEKDLPALVAQVPQDAPLYWVGHSFGGHALGLQPEHARVQAACFFGVGAGWHGWMPRLERLRVWVMWNVLGPLMTRWKGYLPWSLLGMGEDLPLGVYRDWRRWCHFPHYFFDDPARPEMAQRFAQVRTPILAYNALDDLWALPRSREAFMAGYSQAPWRGQDLDPHLSHGHIGHMGYFRPQAQSLWDDCLNHLIGAPNGHGSAAL
jgi:predicted alpha/beta hydrolase